MGHSQDSSDGLFSPKLDAIYFGVHAIFFVLMVAMALGLLPTVSWNQVTVNLIVAILFFNTLHTGLTWLGLFFLPEAREWLKLQWQAEGTFGRLRRWVIVTIFLIITWAVFVTLGRRSLSQDIFIVATIAMAILTVFHNAGQTKGLALSQTYRLRGDKRAALLERRLYDIFVIIISIGSFRILVPWSVKRSIPSWMALAALGVSSVVFIALLVIAYRYQRRVASKKFMFATTAIYHPLLLVSPAAFVFQRALHGIEYLFLSIAMKERSKVEWTKWASFAVVAVLATLAFARWVSLRPGDAINEYLSRGTLITLAFLALWIEYTHYYLDSILFRFQDETVRKTIGPLLKPSA